MSITSADDRITTYQPVVATTTFAADFPVFDNDDIAVYVDGVEREDFSVSATYVQGIANDARAVFNPGITGRVQVVGARDPRRTNRFVNGAPLQIWQQNLALDTVEAEMQEVEREARRAHRAPLGTAGGVFSAEQIASAQSYAQAAYESANESSEFASEAALARDQAVAIAGGLLFNVSSYKYAESISFRSLLAPDYLEVFGYFSPGDGGRALYKRVIAEPLHAGKLLITTALGEAVWYVISASELNVRQFGAIADSTGVGEGTDSHAAINATIQTAIKLKLDVYVPSGFYRSKYDLEFSQADGTYFPSVRGDDPDSTIIFFDEGNDAGFKVRAPSPFIAFFILRDISLWSDGFTGTGLDLYQLTFIDVHRVRTRGWNFGAHVANSISSEFVRLFSDENNIGAIFENTNAITLESPWLANNRQRGLDARKPATLSINGGSIEGNGTDTTIGVNFRGGMVVSNAGDGGHNGVNVKGVYFEHNIGLADLFIYALDGRDVTYTVHGNSFTRMDTAACTLNNISINSDTGNTARQYISLSGNGHGRLGSAYAESAARPYVKVEGSGALVTIDDDGTNMYQNDVARPTFGPAYLLGEAMSARSVGKVTGSSGALVSGTNVTSVQRLAAGRYKVNLRKGWSGPKLPICVADFPRTFSPFSYDDTSVTISVWSGATETDTDFAFAIFKP